MEEFKNDCTDSNKGSALCMANDLKALYESKKCTPGEAAKRIKSGDRVFVGFMSSTAYGMTDALWERRHELEDVLLLSSNGQRVCKLSTEEGEHPFKISTPFIGFGERGARKHGRSVDFTSFSISEAEQWIRDTGRPNVAILMVSPPDEDGYMSYGAAGFCLDAYVKNMAETVILQVNARAPYVRGKDCLIHVSEADYIVEIDEELGEIPEVLADGEFLAVSAHVLKEIPDGATIQLGIGKLGAAIGMGLRERNDLGIHSEMFSDSMMHLIKNGNVTNTRKGFLDGKSVFAFGMGTNELYRFMDHNDDLYGGPFSFVNDVRNIAKNRRMISINSAMSIDLLGQVSAESVGWKQHSGIGGQLDFVIGSQLSEGGKSIIATTSSFIKNGKRLSKIVLNFEPGTAVTTPRSMVQYVATEYGCINLKALTMKDRVRAMISLAHPDFRDELTEQAKQLGLM